MSRGLQSRADRIFPRLSAVVSLSAFIVLISIGCPTPVVAAPQEVNHCYTTIDTNLACVDCGGGDAVECPDQTKCAHDVIVSEMVHYAVGGQGTGKADHEDDASPWPHCQLIKYRCVSNGMGGYNCVNTHVLLDRYCFSNHASGADCP